MWVTPNYQDTDFSCPLNLDDKVRIFLDRTFGWQLNIAEKCLASIPHSGFAVLNIVLSYFEMTAKYQSGYIGTGKSEYYFKQGVYSVFPDLRKQSSKMVDNLLDVLYYGGRCGLYHSGMTDHRIIVTGETRFPMVYDSSDNLLKINPQLLIPALKYHLEGYGKQLGNRKNARMRKNFEKRFDYDALTSHTSENKFRAKGLSIQRTGPPDVLADNLKVVFCCMSAGRRSNLYYADSRNRFWAVLHKTGLIPRPLAPHEFRILPEYRIGLTELGSETEISGLRQKIETFSPSAIAFNGKRPAEGFLGHPVHYGLQGETVKNTAVFVLPSTSGVACKYWNEAHWRDLADFINARE